MGVLNRQMACLLGDRWRLPAVRSKPISVTAWCALRCAIIATLACLVFCPALQAQSAPASEYDVKAAFLYNFAKFIQWPAGPSNGDDPMTICIYGDDPFGHAIDEIIVGKTINNHEIALRRTRKLDDLRQCQVAFISASESGHLSEIIDSLRDLSVLLVGDTSGFAERGGHIEFVTEDNKIHFSINIDASERSRLKISSKLLALARIVHDDGRSGKG